MITRNITIFSFFVFMHHMILGTAYITYELSGGRFGDNLLAFLHGKWFAYKENIPFLYQPFQYSEQLALHYVEQNINTVKNLPKKIITKDYKKELDINKNVIYSVPYFSEDITEYRTNVHWIRSDVNWQDPIFKEQIKKLISPINKDLLSINIPHDIITVALHIRRSGGYDGLLAQDLSLIQPGKPYVDIGFPLKVPHFSFYIDALRKISNHFNNNKLYIFLFTDDKNPLNLIEQIKKNLPNRPNLLFDCRKQGNAHYKNVVEDFFAMIQFDCIIRPQSNYSLVASKIKDYQVEIYPSNYIRKEGKPVITDIKMIVRN